MRKLKIVKKWEKQSLYKKSLILFSVLCLILGGIFLSYVYNSMIIYERNLVDNYIAYLASSGKMTKDINDDLFPISSYEKKGASITKGVKKLYQSDNLKIKKNTKLSKEDTFAYDLYNGDKLISTVSLKSKNSYTRMAILKIDEWEIVDHQDYFEKGIYSYEITIPSNYHLFINDKEVEKDMVVQEKDVEGLERLTKYIEIQKTKKYEINNLVNEPDIKITDNNNKNVDFKIKDNKIVVNNGFKEVKTYDEAKKYLKNDFDILKLAENWSLFLTDDLQGSYHGLSTLMPYLINGSYMYDMAYGWSHNVDITFVSNHSLKNPPFTNEEVKNCVIYNDNAFSCEVYLEKNMLVRGENRKDVMHDRLYFIYYENAYRLVDMQAIKD